MNQQTIFGLVRPLHITFTYLETDDGCKYIGVLQADENMQNKVIDQSIFLIIRSRSYTYKSILQYIRNFFYNKQVTTLILNHTDKVNSVIVKKCQPYNYFIIFNVDKALKKIFII